jgi:hypothetical protein
MAFDASLSGLQGGSSNAFFDLMEMSSVLSSSGLIGGGDPLVDSTGSGGIKDCLPANAYPPYINMIQNNMISSPQNNVNNNGIIKDMGYLMN